MGAGASSATEAIGQLENLDGASKTTLEQLRDLMTKVETMSMDVKEVVYEQLNALVAQKMSTPPASPRNDDACGELDIGDEATPFTLSDTDFAQKTLDGLQGMEKKTVLLVFVPQPGSPQCEQFINDIKGLLGNVVGPYTLVIISKEFPFILKMWKEKLGLEYSILSDHKMDISLSYVGCGDYGSHLDSKGVSKGDSGYKSPNRGIIAIKAGKVVFKWLGMNAASYCDPDIMVDKESLAAKLKEL